MVGVEAVQKRVMNSFADDDPFTRGDRKMLSDRLLSPDSARKMMAGAGALPAYPIRVGESWAFAVEPPIGLPFRSKLKGERTVNLLTPDLAYIADNALYDGASNSANKGKTVYDMSGVEGGMLGTSRVERESGLTLESALSQRLGGATVIRQINGAGRVLSAKSLPISLVTSGRIVLEPR